MHFGSNLDSLMAEAQRLAARSEEVLGDLRERSAEGAAANGQVTATADVLGGTIREINVSARAVRTLNNFSLAEAIVEAVHAAEAEAERVRTEEFGGLRFEGRSILEIFRAGPDLSGLPTPPQ